MRHYLPVKRCGVASACAVRWWTKGETRTKGPEHSTITTRRSSTRSRAEFSTSSNARDSHSPSPSFLLRNISLSLNAIRRLYEQQAEEKLRGPHPYPSASASPQRRDHPSRTATPSRLLSSSSFTNREVAEQQVLLPPRDPQTPEEGEQILQFFCRELDMGESALRRWRDGVAQRSRSRWHLQKDHRDDGGGSTSSATSANNNNNNKNNDDDEALPAVPSVLPPLYLEHVASKVPVDVWRAAAEFATDGTNPTPRPSSSSSGWLSNEKERLDGLPPSGSPIPRTPPEHQRSLYFYPRPQDTAFVQHCIRDLQAVVSPFITLSPPPRLTRRTRATSSFSSSPPLLQKLPNDKEAAADVTLAFNDATAEDLRPYTHRTCSTWYATRFIPAGMFVMSLPTAAGFFAHPATPNVSPLRLQEQRHLRATQDHPRRPLAPAAVTPATAASASPSSTMMHGEIHAEDEGRQDTNYYHHHHHGNGNPSPGGEQENMEAPVEDTCVVEDGAASLGCQDPYLLYFQELDDLVGQLCLSPELPAAAAVHHDHNDSNGPTRSASADHIDEGSGYDFIQYWKESVVPCRNLPFIRSKAALFDALSPFTKEKHKNQKNQMETSPEEEGPEAELEQSAAYGLWSFFHETLQQKPLSPVLREFFTGDGVDASSLPPQSQPQQARPATLAEYHWWLSLVLSRRLGGSCLMPMVDKLNHDAMPNCFYTMADPVPSGSSSSALLSSMTGIDVFNNITAGVPLLFAYEPYVHVFTMRDVYPGEALTLCYQSPPHEVYRPAHLTPLTPSLFSSTAESQDGKAQNGGERNTSLTSRLRARASALRLHHPGTPHVKTVEGQGSWLLQWGFVPDEDAIFSDKDLVEVGTLLSEKRVEERRKMFPKTTREASSMRKHISVPTTLDHQIVDDSTADEFQ